MKVDVIMPKLGESITEGTISKWLKKPGDTIARDEILLEISTDKVESEIPSPVSGVLTEILAHEGETVPVDATIARVDTAAAIRPGIPLPASESQIESLKSIVVSAPADAVKSESILNPEQKTGRFYSPLVLNIARREGISMPELEQISGTGLTDRVTKKDILSYLERKKSQPAMPGRPALAALDKKISWAGNEVEIVPMDGIRRHIAEHMRQSLDTSAHVYVASICDVSRIMELIKTLRTDFERDEGFKLTFTPFVLQTVARTLGIFPRLNSSVEGTQIIVKKRIHIGMAVATESGLIVPVIKNAEEKSFRGLARAANDLAVRARNKKLSPDDVQGVTFSVTNFGVFGNIMGFPIIHQPNVAILGVGAIKKQPVVVETDSGDVIAIRSMVYLSLSFDHRIIDGDLGGRFLQTIAQNLENFTDSI